MPILQLAKALKPLEPGEEVLLLATDPAVRSDVPAWCDATGHTLLSLEAREGFLEARIRKAAG
jgi:TusA-related sulfurtransferase